MTEDGFHQTGIDAIDAYVDDVLDERIPACRWVRLACERHRQDVTRSLTTPWPYLFDAKKAAKVIRYVELLPHVKDEWAGQPLRMRPWQKFILGSLFGWVHKDGGMRRFRYAYICVPRKNSKSTMSAGIGLYMLTADGEPGAEIYSGATSEKQAWEVFRPAREMAKRRAALLQSAYGLSINAKSLETRDGSRFEPVIGKPGDGASPHCAIIDEYHEHISDELYETMVTGMVARRQPLALVITTAGSDISGPCYTLQLDTQKVLEGNLDKDDLFGVVYTIDQDDDWTKPEALAKANPNYDVSVRPLAVISEQKYAVEQSRKQAAFKTKHLNVWVTSRDAWMNLQWWDRQADRTLRREDFAGETCWSALDLSSKYDLTAVVTCFRREQAGDWHYYLFGRYYIPEETAASPDKRHYQQWIADGHLVATDGDIIDFARVEQDIVADSKRFALAEVAYDPWGATQIAQRLQEEHGLTPVEVPQTTKHLSEPMKMLEALTRTGRVHHDGNPCLAWMISNVTVREDANENIFPRKDVPDAKIDGAVACIMALGRALAPEAKLADDLLWVTL